ncbi:hypothetical protein [Halobacillus sp. Marseille-Q1614]|uniref:hypothetical protein n=1 Tax=Halobacillus sp. Marseille-Q1614 TaxID=2709134 RepID=UPI00156EAD52|nr:hypothetical protein [Halobacillus sp. Marseille-Q1614]
MTPKQVNELYRQAKRGSLSHHRQVKSIRLNRGRRLSQKLAPSNTTKSQGCGCGKKKLRP